MLEAFLILLVGGVMLAAAIPDPRDVTLNWLRLSGIISLTLAGLSALVMWQRSGPTTEPLPTGSWLLLAFATLCILLQLAFTQVSRRNPQRVLALAAFVLAVLCAMSQQPIFPQTVAPWQTRSPGVELFLSWFGIAAMCGIALMDMLLGHAYLTASQMTMQPSANLNRALEITLIIRAVSAIALVLVLEHFWPIPKLWGIHGLLIGTRWFVGLLVPAVFVYMAHDCIKRRATQSATGILYVAGVLIFLGEIIALQLVRETGLPF